MPKKVILDCDPGIDDAFAIMLAVSHLDVLGITTIGGNCTLENVTRNALSVLEVLGRADIPVFPGHSCPMAVPLVTAPQFHGKNGFGNVFLPDPSAMPGSRHAVDFITDTVMHTDDVTLLATGPLTNIAAAINREPGIAERVSEICIMGGSVTCGNWTPAAEFNIYVDPEAAYRVFNSGIHIKMTGLNLTRQCCLMYGDVEKIRAIGTGASDLAADLLSFYVGAYTQNSGSSGAYIHDACAAAWLIKEELIKSAPMHIDVELKGEYTRGMTVCDYRNYQVSESSVDISRMPRSGPMGQRPNAEAALELDFGGFMELLCGTLAGYQ